MAGSRIERFTSIVKRCEGLMKGGALKKKPLWYDIYVKHPPFCEPTILREKSDVPVNEIFYEEDIQMAQKMNQMSKIGLNANDKKQIKNELRIKDRKGGRKNVNLFDLSD